MSRKIRDHVAALLMFFALVSPAQARVMAESIAPERAIDSEIRRTMEEGGLVGLAAAIIVDGKVVWTGAYGFADRERGTPFTTDTVLNVASVSKTVVGAAMMRAVEEG